MIYWRILISSLPKPMSILSWNCRGLGNPSTIQSFKEIIKDKQLKLIFLMETMILKEQVSKIKKLWGMRVLL